MNCVSLSFFFSLGNYLNNTQTTSASLLNILLFSYMRLFFFEPTFSTKALTGTTSHPFFLLCLILIFILKAILILFFFHWVFGQATLQRGVLRHTLGISLNWGLYIFILVTLFCCIYFMSMYIKAELPTHIEQRTNCSPLFTNNIHFLLHLRISPSWMYSNYTTLNIGQCYLAKNARLSSPDNPFSARYQAVTR